jgi:exodeoxyribonuclease VII large subunit
MARLNLYPESGHCYPDLVEKEGKNIKAQMRGTIWAGNYQRISRKFLEIAREPLKDGIQILFFATVKFHPQYGLSLQISDIDPTFTLGQMARDRLETIRKLKEEEVFDLNRDLPFPILPKRIAVISVATSKGYSDFMKILEGIRHSYNFYIVLFPALLQGEKAVESIAGQLQRIRRAKNAFDAVAIIRGGGGDIGLSCYDDYRLAREVATFPLPVITGIGHSTNETIVEMVAARNKITPTDVAYYLVEHFDLFAERLKEIGQTIFGYALDLIATNKETLHSLADRMQGEALKHLDYRRMQLDTFMKSTLHNTRLRLRSEDEKLAAAVAILKYVPVRSLRQKQENLHNDIKWLSSKIAAFSERENSRVRLAESRIMVLDPANTLKRGFSITYHENKPLKDANNTSSGDTIKTRLYQGEITSVIHT